jgi:chemotaxis response regulator CheB
MTGDERRGFGTAAFASQRNALGNMAAGATKAAAEVAKALGTTRAAAGSAAGVTMAAVGATRAAAEAAKAVVGFRPIAGPPPTPFNATGAQENKRRPISPYDSIDTSAIHSRDVKVRASTKSVIAIGASTGGTEAIAAVMTSLPPGLPGIVVVQHMPQDFTGMFAQRLNTQCAYPVREARTGDRIAPNTALIAPGNIQFKVIKDVLGYSVLLFPGEKVSGHCPSVDVMFSSIAKSIGPNAIGVILTGMGQDGAHGLLEMRQAGAKTIGQDEKTCVVYGMPKVAYEIGAVVYQLPLDQIALKIVSLV